MAQKREKKSDKGTAPEGEVKANPEVIEKGKEIRKNIDGILDEVDKALEENAEALAVF